MEFPSSSLLSVFLTFLPFLSPFIRFTPAPRRLDSCASFSCLLPYCLLSLLAFCPCFLSLLSCLISSHCVAHGDVESHIHHRLVSSAAPHAFSCLQLFPILFILLIIRVLAIILPRLCLIASKTCHRCRIVYVTGYLTSCALMRYTRAKYRIGISSQMYQIMSISLNALKCSLIISSFFGIFLFICIETHASNHPFLFYFRLSTPLTFLIINLYFFLFGFSIDPLLFIMSFFMLHRYRYTRYSASNDPFAKSTGCEYDSSTRCERGRVWRSL